MKTIKRLINWSAFGLCLIMMIPTGPIYDNDQLRIHQTYGWEMENGKKEEMESDDEYIIIHRITKFY